MRKNSFLVRSWRKSNDRSSPLASLPVDEANEYFCSGVISTTHCDTDVEIFRVTTHCDSDVEIVRDTFDEGNLPHKKRHYGGTSDTDGGQSAEPQLNLDACIVCEVADEQISHCYGLDCLLSFHRECLCTVLGDISEDLANRYCPYCWLNILELKSITLREKAVLAEKAVSKYLRKEMKNRDEDRTSSGGENGNQENSVDGTDIVRDQELQGGKDRYSSKGEQVQVEKEFEISRGEKTDKVINEVGASEDEERVATENFQDAEDDKNDKTARVSTGAGKKRGVSPFLLMQESITGKEHDKVKQNEKRKRRRLIKLNTTDSETSSNGPSNEQNGEDVTEQVTSSAKVINEVGASEDEERVATENFQDAEDDKNDKTAKDQTRVSTGAGKKRCVSPFLPMQESITGNEHDQVKQNEKRKRRRLIVLNTTDSETSSNGPSNEQNGEDVTEQVTSSAQVTSPSGKMKNQQATTKVVAESKTVRDIFRMDHRRRILWTCEEEEMLKVGVEIFAAEAKKNMPWRKILEMGKKVFHETRSPSDLKDKWRNMIGARLGPKTNETAQ